MTAIAQRLPIHSKGFVRGAIAVLMVYAIVCPIFLSLGQWWFALFPLALGMLAFLVLKPVSFWFLLVFLTPFTVNVEVLGLGSRLALPVEPFVLIFMILLILKFLLDDKLDGRILRHPITIIIIIHLIWMALSTCFSSMPIVSFKYLLSRLWFVTVFYFFGLHVFKKMDGIDKFHWYYILGLSVLIVYTLIRHSTGYFSHEYSYKAALPFFSDHNIYAVVLAFFVPTTVVYALKARALGQSVVRGMAYWVLLALFAVGVIASYTRAAWVSLAAALMMYFLLSLTIRLRTLLLAAALLGGGLAITWNDIVLYMSKNKVESDSKLDAHVKSIYNVTTDDSNTERINRWSAALRMFLEKPVFGFGPNTYQFQYGPYQLSRQKTKISTNLGLLGNAHSEYIGPLAEQGLIGGLLVIALMLAVVHRAMQLYYKAIDARVKYLALMVLLSLVSYYAHGLLNNYLDVDKANVLFWASIAIITSLDVYHSQGAVSAPPTNDAEDVKTVGTSG